MSKKKFKKILFFLAIPILIFPFHGISQTPSFSEQSSVRVPIKPDEQKEATCQNNTKFRGRNYQIKRETSKLWESFKFLDTTPTKIASSIYRVYYEKPHLQIEFESKALYEERSGSVYKTVEKTVYEGNPGTELILNTLLIGIPLLLNPINSVQSAAGCTDERILEKFVPINLSEKTGKSEVSSITQPYKIKLTGLGADRILEIVPRLNNGLVLVNINLSEGVLQSSIEGITKLEVHCLNCRPDNQDDRLKLSSIKTFISLDADLTSLRKEVFQERERQIEVRRLEQEAIAKAEIERKERVLAEEKRQEILRKEETLKRQKEDQEALTRRKKEEQEALLKRKREEQEELIRRKESEKRKQVFQL